MKNLFLTAGLLFFILSCKKETPVQNITQSQNILQGTKNILIPRDTTIDLGDTTVHCWDYADTTDKFDAAECAKVLTEGTGKWVISTDTFIFLPCDSSLNHNCNAIYIWKDTTQNFENRQEKIIWSTAYNFVFRALDNEYNSKFYWNYIQGGYIRHYTILEYCPKDFIKLGEYDKIDSFRGYRILKYEK